MVSKTDSALAKQQQAAKVSNLRGGQQAIQDMAASRCCMIAPTPLLVAPGA